MNPYEIRIYKWKPMGDHLYDDPAHSLHTSRSLKRKGFRPYIVTRGIPAVDIQYSFKLDDIGQASVTIPLDGPEEWQPALQGLADLDPYRYCIGIVRSNQLVWAGIIWNMRMDLSNRTLQINARDFISFYENRNYTGQARDREQTEMIRDIINTANSNWGVNTELSLTKTERTKDWSATVGEWREVASDLYDMADDLSGFFLQVRSSLANAGKPDEYLRHAIHNTKDRTPQWAKGTDGKNLPPLKDRVNCEIPEVYFDGSQVTTTSYAIGRAGNLPIKRRKDNLPLRREVPVRDVVGRYDSLKSASMLDSRAETQLAFGNRSIRVPRILSYPGAYPEPHLLDPNLGIKIEVEAHTGFVSFEEAFVLTENRVSVEGDGTERLELTLVQEGFFKKGQWD